LRSEKLISIINQSVKQFKLDLSGLGVFVPAFTYKPVLFPLVAALASAKNVFVQGARYDVIERLKSFENQLGGKTNFVFIDNESPHVLSNTDILIKNEALPYIDAKYASALKRNSVISVFPYDFDFLHIKDINFEDCSKKGISVIAVDPGDKNLSLYRYFANIVLKRCYEAGISVFKSKIVILGTGELMESIISLLNSCGAQIYAAHADNPESQNYVTKHLREADGLILADYPPKSGMLVGNEGLIKILDLTEINPDVKIIHIAGKVQTHSLSLSNISFVPEVITQSSINFDITKADITMLSNCMAAVLKAAEERLELNKKPGGSPVIPFVKYNDLNPIKTLLGEQIFI